MEKYVVEEITKDLKWYEKVVVKLFKKTFFRVYNISRISVINAIERTM